MFLQDYFCSGKQISKEQNRGWCHNVPISESVSQQVVNKPRPMNMKQENQDLKLQLSALAVAPCVQDLPISAEYCGCFLCQRRE